MDFNNQFPEWQNQGTEPSEELKTNGFQGGYKPPAGVFNWFWSKVMTAITEIQSKLSSEETARLNADNGKVDKVEGKGLSSNDYTSEEKNKLAGIEEGATNTLVSNSLTDTSTTNALSAAQGKVLNDGKANKQTLFGGFAGGLNATVNTGGGAVGREASTAFGGAIGYEVSTTDGGAIGKNAESTNGGAVGLNASSTNGGAVGANTSSTTGGAIGISAVTTLGGAIGTNARSSFGGAIGADTLCGYGFAGGYNARAIDSIETENGINAIQLGSGTNTEEYTLQVYDYQMMDANGKIPNARLPITIQTTAPTSTQGVNGDICIVV